MSTDQRSSIPITVRQLEAIIRISESLAKLALSPVANESHVDEAIRLFLASTMDAVAAGERAVNHGALAAGGASGGGVSAATGLSNRSVIEEAAKVEEEIRRRLHVGWTISMAALSREFVEGRGYSDASFRRALMVMQKRNSIQLRLGGTKVYRSGV